MSCLELWLVRHGESLASREGSLAGWRDVALTEAGRAQARALQELLHAESFSSVWSSDLSRAAETARLAWGEPRVDPRLREMDFGELEGCDWHSLDEHRRVELLEFVHFRSPGGESYDELRERVLGFVAELPPGRHLLFTHGVVIRMLLWELGEDRLVPTATVVALDWGGRKVLFERTPGESDDRGRTDAKLPPHPAAEE